MKRILFVDDEVEILEALQSLLRKHRRQWDMTFALGGESALEKLATTKFDVVISDMRMPGMDGAELLKKVKRDTPETVRIILSGYSDTEATIRLSSVAHQFLNKPCDVKTLEFAIESTCNVQKYIRNDSIRQAIGNIDQLPAIPRVYSQLTDELKRVGVKNSELARIIEQDVAISAKLLQLVNSAFFRLSRKIIQIEEAVIYLGIETIKNLVLLTETIQSGSMSKTNWYNFSPDSFQQHALLTASIAKNMLSDPERAEYAFMAGLLHDIGLLVLILSFPDKISEAVTISQQQQRPLHRIEKEMYGSSHAEIGAFLLTLWNLSCPVIEAVAFHHTPEHSSEINTDIVSAVYIANILANEVMGNSFDNDCKCFSGLELKYVDELGLTDKIEVLRIYAEHQFQIIKHL